MVSKSHLGGPFKLGYIAFKVSTLAYFQTLDGNQGSRPIGLHCYRTI